MSFKLLISRQSRPTSLVRYNPTTLQHTSTELQLVGDSASFSPDFKTAVVKVMDKLMLVQLDSLSIRNAMDIQDVDGVCWGVKSAKSIYVCSVPSNTVITYSRTQAKILHSYSIQKPSLITSNADDSKLAVISKSNAIAIISTRSATITYLVTPTTASVTSLAWYPFKKSVLVAGFSDGTVALWDVNNAKEASVVKLRVHSAPVTGVSFAPCNKHFWCSVGMDSMLFFHDINSGKGKGFLQSYKAESPLTCLTINDDHSVAIGTDSGSVMVYDLRLKKVVYTIGDGGSGKCLSVSWQPPKWAIVSASKEIIVDATEEMKSTENLKEDDTTKSPAVAPKLTSALAPSSTSTSVMDMFSPVNKKQTAKTITGVSSLLKNAALGSFHEKLKSATGDGSLSKKLNETVLSTPLSSTLPRSDTGAVNRMSKSVSASEVRLKSDSVGETLKKMSKSMSMDNLTPVRATELEIDDDEVITPTARHQQATAQKQNVEPSRRLDSGNPVSVLTKSDKLKTLNSQQVPLSEPPKSIQFQDLRNVPASEPPKFSAKNFENSLVPQPPLTSIITQESQSKLGSVLNLAPLQEALITETSKRLTFGIASGPSGDSIPITLIKNVVEKIVAEHIEEVRQDIQNLHVELLREFQSQKMEIEDMLERHASAAKLMDIVEGLQRENDRLRRNF